jgi:hypothetical protein
MNEIWERVLANSFSGIHKSKIICSARLPSADKHKQTEPDNDNLAILLWRSVFASISCIGVFTLNEEIKHIRKRRSTAGYAVLYVCIMYVYI